MAGAAFQTLAALYPAQVADLRLAFDAFFKAHPDLALKAAAAGSGSLDWSGGAAGAAWGAYVGNALLRQRAADPVANIVVPFVAYTPPSPPSVFPPPYAPAPSTPNAGLYAPYYGNASALFSTSTRFVLDPPGLDAAAYAAQVDVLWAKGTADYQFGAQPPPIAAARRTAVQNTTGIIWGYDGQRHLGTPPRLYNQFVRAVAKEHGNSEADNARLFAFVNAAMGDAGVLAWEVRMGGGREAGERARGVGRGRTPPAARPAGVCAGDGGRAGVRGRPAWRRKRAARASRARLWWPAHALTNTPRSSPSSQTKHRTSTRTLSAAPRPRCGARRPPPAPSPPTGCRWARRSPTPSPTCTPSRPTSRPTRPGTRPSGRPRSRRVDRERERERGGGHAPARAASAALLCAPPLFLPSIQITRLFYGAAQPGVFTTETRTRRDAAFHGAFVSDEYDGVSFNALGRVRPLVVRSYTRGGLWGAMMDNALSRVYLGVHWLFDAYATAGPVSPTTVDTAPPDLGTFVGGVPLGLAIADDIFGANGVAPAFTGTPVPQAPYAPAVVQSAVPAGPTSAPGVVVVDSFL